MARAIFICVSMEPASFQPTLLIINVLTASARCPLQRNMVCAKGVRRSYPTSHLEIHSDTHIYVPLGDI